MSIIETIKELLERFRPHSQAVALGDTLAVADGSRLVHVDGRGPCRLHTLTGRDSFVAYANIHGSADSAVYVDASGVRLVIDEIKGADHSLVRMVLDPSTAIEAWQKSVGQDMSPIRLRNFIEDRAGDLVSKSTLAAVSAFKARVEVEFDADLENDAETVFRVKEGAKGTKAEIPKEFGIKVPLWLGHAERYEVSIGLDVALSKDGPPSFRMRFRDLPDVRDMALGELRTAIQGDLPGWLVVRGVPKAGSAVVASLLSSGRDSP
jgi:uncharacterized protein YfdQ (DUF2303 family)